MKPWDHSKIVDLELLIWAVSLRAHQTSKTPYSLQNNVPKSKQMAPGTKGPRDPGTRDQRLCRVCGGCVSAMCSVCVSQPESKNPRPAPNAKSATSPKSRWDSSPPRHPCCEKWCGAYFFHDASDEKPVSPSAVRVIKFYFRGCFVRKACVGP